MNRQSASNDRFLWGAGTPANHANRSSAHTESPLKQTNESSVNDRSQPIRSDDLSKQLNKLVLSLKKKTKDEIVHLLLNYSSLFNGEFGSNGIERELTMQTNNLIQELTSLPIRSVENRNDERVKSNEDERPVNEEDSYFPWSKRPMKKFKMGTVSSEQQQPNKTNEQILELHWHLRDRIICNLIDNLNVSSLNGCTLNEAKRGLMKENICLISALMNLKVNSRIDATYLNSNLNSVYFSHDLIDGSGRFYETTKDATYCNFNSRPNSDDSDLVDETTKEEKDVLEGAQLALELSTISNEHLLGPKSMMADSPSELFSFCFEVEKIGKFFETENQRIKQFYLKGVQYCVYIRSSFGPLTKTGKPEYLKYYLRPCKFPSKDQHKLYRAKYRLKILNQEDGVSELVQERTETFQRLMPFQFYEKAFGMYSNLRTKFVTNDSMHFQVEMQVHPE